MPLRPRLRHLSLAGALLTGAAGLLLLSDKPGLEGEYFALDPAWGGEPTARRTGPPRITGPEDLTAVLVSRVICSVRWRGWLDVERGGPTVFELSAGGTAHLAIDGAQVLATGGGRQPARGEIVLSEGLHHVEVGLGQVGQPSRLDLLWRTPGAREAAPVPEGLLYPRRPATLYRLARETTARLSPPGRRLLGVVFLLAALFLLRSTGVRPGALVRRLGARVGRRLPASRSRNLRIASLGALFLVTFLASLPFAGETLGGDDVRYQEAASFDREARGYLNRYAHVYLLKGFVGLSGGDPFLGSRLLWSFLLATTATALAAAAAALGSGLQLGTLAVTLFLLASQTSLLGNFGAVFPDVTAMAFVTVGVAVYLHGRARGMPERPLEWHALALGALTVAAFKSKETGLILVWLVPLLLWNGERIDLPRFGRRVVSWAAGAAAAYLGLMLLDACFLGDPFYSLRWENLAAVGDTNFAAEALASRRGPGGWIDVLAAPWGGAHPADYGLRNLGLLTLAAAFLAAARGEPTERRLLHLMPVAYLLMMIALHVRATYIYSPRYLLPVLPVACLTGGMLFHYLGVDGGWWRDLARPARLTPLALAVAVIVLVLVPLRVGDLEAEALLPAGSLAKLGWTPENLVASTVGPALLLLLAAAAVLLARNAEARLLLLLICLLGFFGVGAELNRKLLAIRFAEQRADLLLYPWTAFEREIRDERPVTLVVSPDLFRRYGMVGQQVVRQPLARLFFRRDDLSVWQAPSPGPEIDFAVAGRRDYQRWVRQAPALAATAVSDPSGLLVLVRPRQARSEGAPGGP